MVKWFRSTEMEYIKIIFQEDVGRKLMDEIGNYGAIHFTDLNYDLTPFQRRFASYIRRCDEIDRKIRFFDTELQKTGDHHEYSDFLKMMEHYRNISLNKVINEVEESIGTKESDLRQLNAILQAQSSEYNYKLEFNEAITKCSAVFASRMDQIRTLSTPRNESLEEGNRESGLRFQYICGAIPSQEQANLDRVIFRATRGHCVVYFFPMDSQLIDIETGQPSNRHISIFIVFYRYDSIESKIRRICTAYGSTLFQISNLDKLDIVATLRKDAEQDILDSQIIFSAAKNNRLELLNLISAQLLNWKWKVQHEKAIFNVLNMCYPEVGGTLRAEGWVRRDLLDVVRQAVHTSSDENVGVIERVDWTGLKPPTHFTTNYFTSIYQSMTDTYGMATYQEANPSVVNLITFPFLFGVMYGDLAFLLLIFSVIIIVWEKRLQKADLGEMFDMVFAGRYILILMSIFAFYCGFLYNDCFGLSFNTFNTAYTFPDPESNDTYATKLPGLVYPFGVDPIWRASTNELTFVNSMKMKMAIIVGVVHMLLGVLIKIGNNVYRKSYLELCVESIPQFILLFSLFGYMCFMIIFKWCVDWDPTTARGEPVPELITTLINMALQPGTIDVPLFANQNAIQVALLVIAILCIPVMLLVKPTKILYDQKHHPHHESPALVEYRKNPTIVLEEKEPSGFEIYIHQGIETIEYILGCLSNTASYLRLWALSLAHSQLSAVFWEQIFVLVLNMKNAFVIFVGYYLYACATFAVLLVMDSLECFLHALRLHWVEFQNKYYKGSGYAFQPLEFKVK